MKVNLKQVSEQPLKISATLDLSELKRFGEHPIQSPVAVEAVFVRKNGVLSVVYKADLFLEGPCARCLEPQKKPVSIQMEHILVQSLEDETNDDFILVPDGVLLLDELVQSDISLELDGILLCSDGCEGLCPICGANKNTGGCDCDASIKDARFDKLRELMRDNEG